MVSTASQLGSADLQVKTAIDENLLTPRFYTTDFDKAANLDLSTGEADLKTMVAEMRADYNRHHFTRSDAFKGNWDHIQGEDRAAFIEYLERSCVSEFSGFLLFKELSRKLKDRSPLLAEVFHLMARDEARHAGFLNKAMGDFNVSLDLAKLTRHRTYTFFPVEWVIYAVYLSEKLATGATSLSIAIYNSSRKTAFTPSLTTLKAGVKTKTATAIFSKPCCDRSPTCGRAGKRGFGVAFSYCRSLPPTP
jgi:magnesium-protoporphyrin IX monomethyl ester (oxidative) cyclase